MRVCDVCKREVVGAGAIWSLKEQYQQPGIEEVCKECLDEITNIVETQRTIYVGAMEKEVLAKWDAFIKMCRENEKRR